MSDTAHAKINPDVAADLARLALDLSHNPETRREFGKLVKKAKPNTPHAQAFADVEIEDKFETFKSDLEAKEIKRQQDAVMARMNAQRARLIDGDEEGRKYSEDDVKKIEALMERKGIVDYDDGRILYSATLPPESPKPVDVPVHGTTWEFPEFAKFGKDPVKASRDVAAQVISEFQRKQR